MSEGCCLTDGAAHRDGNRVGRTRKGTSARAAPTAESETGGWRGGEFHNRATVFPSARGSYLAPSSRTHSQKVLFREGRRVSSVLSWSNTMRYRSTVTPLTPHIPNTGITILGRCCRNRVTCPRLPGKRLGRSVGRSVNHKAWASYISLHRYLNWVLDETGRLTDRPTHHNRDWVVRT